MQPALQPRVVTSTVVSAAPHIRDLQKELTQLVPASLLRKKTAGSASSAPPLAPKPAPAPASASDAGSSKKSNSNVEDDYDSFMKSIQGL